MKKVIHVNRHNIAKNKKGGKEPVFTVKTYKSNTKGKSVKIDGPCELVYSPDKPLSCGAVAYIVTNSIVLVDGVLI